MQTSSVISLVRLIGFGLGDDFSQRIKMSLHPGRKNLEMVAPIILQSNLAISCHSLNFGLVLADKGFCIDLVFRAGISPYGFGAVFITGYLERAGTSSIC